MPVTSSTQSSRSAPSACSIRSGPTSASPTEQPVRAGAQLAVQHQQHGRAGHLEGAVQPTGAQHRGRTQGQRRALAGDRGQRRGPGRPRVRRLPRRRCDEPALHDPRALRPRRLGVLGAAARLQHRDVARAEHGGADALVVQLAGHDLRDDVQPDVPVRREARPRLQHVLVQRDQRADRGAVRVPVHTGRQQRPGARTRAVRDEADGVPQHRDRAALAKVTHQ